MNRPLRQQRTTKASLVRADARIVELMTSRATRRKDDESRAAELLKMEYEGLRHAFAANEEMAEKRVSLFMTLTAGLGAAAFVAADKLGQHSPPITLILLAVSAAWLFFGYLTLLRILHRNRTTDDNKGKLRRLRAWFVKRSDREALAVLPYPAYGGDDVPRTFRFWARSGGRGGYAELVAFINALIAGSLGYQVAATALLFAAPGVSQGFALATEAASAIVWLLVAWWHQSRLAHRYYRTP